MKTLVVHAFRHAITAKLYHRDVPQEELAFITKHSLMKTVSVLQDYYLHKRPDRARVKQSRALELYRPGLSCRISGVEVQKEKSQLLLNHFEEHERINSLHW
ncbi:hypothetical protein [Xanthomonas arboricola]|uniref:hypothetical protein n=1 Tax=Xanthomonas arboricola TaxID=56448 RepID=UPI000C842EC6|nr:hypothetical protein [Xanthomonas arboricola]